MRCQKMASEKYSAFVSIFTYTLGLSLNFFIRLSGRQPSLVDGKEHPHLFPEGAF